MKRSSIQNLIILVLVTLYLAGSGFVVIYGAQFYTTMVKENDLSLNQQTTLLYFNHRIKQHDGQGMIQLITQNGITALCFTQDDYSTLVYEFNGFLVEQSSESARIDSLEAQKIIALSNLSFKLNQHTLTITYMNSQGQTITLNYTLLAAGPLA